MVKAKQKPSEFFIHLVSDSTGSTLQGLAKACLAQFEGVVPHEKYWNLIRTSEQIEMVLDGIADEPGPVLMTLVNPDLRGQLRSGCRKMKLPCVPVLDPILSGLSSYLGKEGLNTPGLQHKMDDAYFRRIDALDYALHHDDGQMMDGLDQADVILVGVSRTSKTPTSIYLANRGIKAANIPLVPNVKIDESFFQFTKPLYVGLTESPARLLETRKSRLIDDEKDAAAFRHNAYLDEEAITDEIKSARKLFSMHGWPVIDVTKRSIEETAAEIMTILLKKKHNQTGSFLP
jgi:regulator of PEP synthase PpsR (kinase-PPPase family)